MLEMADVRNKTFVGVDGRSTFTTEKGGGKDKERNRWEEVEFKVCSFVRRNS